MKSKSMGANPLEPMIAVEEDNSKEPKRSRPQKEQATFHLTVELMDRIRDVVYWTPGYTLTRFAEEALRHAVSQFEKKRGEPFPQRKEPLPLGRPSRR